MAISISPEVTERVRPPRAVTVRFPFGHALGEPDHRPQQRRVLLEALKLLGEARAPEIRHLDHLRWKRTNYAALPEIKLP